MKTRKNLPEKGDNYLQLICRRPFRDLYLFVDVEDFCAVQYLANRGVRAKVHRIFSKEGWDYLNIICFVPKRQAEEFRAAMEDTARHFLLNGHGDYLDVCRDMFALIERNVHNRRMKTK